MRKNKKIYKRLFIGIIAIYVVKEYKEELAKKQEDVSSLEFIEQTAREKLDMYYPNEKVYIDNGM